MGIILGLLITTAIVEFFVIIGVYNDLVYHKDRADRNYDDWKAESARCKKLRASIQKGLDDYYK